MKSGHLILIIMGSLVGAIITGFIIYRYRKKIANVAVNGYEWVTGEKKEEEPTEIRRKSKDDLDDLTVQVEKLKIEILVAGEFDKKLKKQIGKLDQSYKEQMMRLDKLTNKAIEFNKRNAEMFPNLPRTDEERAQSAKKHEKEMEEIRRQGRCIDAFRAATRANIALIRSDGQETQVISHFCDPNNILTYTPEQISANLENSAAKVEQTKGKCKEAENEFYRLSNEIDEKQSEKIVLGDDGGSQKQSEQGNVVS